METLIESLPKDCGALLFFAEEVKPGQLERVVNHLIENGADFESESAKREFEETSGADSLSLAEGMTVKEACPPCYEVIEEQIGQKIVRKTVLRADAPPCALRDALNKMEER
jgi:hypothetical protein